MFVLITNYAKLQTIMLLSKSKTLYCFAFFVEYTVFVTL